MKIEKLSLRNFRSYEQRTFTFGDTLTAIVGPNGAGKTNLLEAVYTLLSGKSFRDTDEDLIRFEQRWWKIEGEFDTKERRELRFSIEAGRAKQLVADNGKKTRFTYKHELPVVLFEPDHLQMIHTSPGKRRQYIDEVLLSTDPVYRTIMARYERALTQRNNLLKQRLSGPALHDQLFVWDIALADYGITIMKKRAQIIDRINTVLGDVYSSIAGSNQTLKVIYLPSYDQGVFDGSQFVQTLAAHLPDDSMRGFTTVGPHRDDVGVLLSGKSAKQTASRGEVRSIVLALKQVEAEILEEITHTKPLVLLDDVLSELDENRQRKIISGSYQTIITTTHIKHSEWQIIDLSIDQI